MKAFLVALILLGAAAGGWYYYSIYQPQAAQKRTVYDIRNIGTAWMSWLTDQVTQGPEGPSQTETSVHPIQLANLSAANPAPQSQKTYNASNLKQITYAQLKVHLYPPGQEDRPQQEKFFYMEVIPEFDGWGHPYEFYLNENLLMSNVMLVRSPGRDGVFSDYPNNQYPTGSFDPSNYDDDIVWADGYMVRWPE